MIYTCKATQELDEIDGYERTLENPYELLRILEDNGISHVQTEDESIDLWIEVRDGTAR